MKSSFEIQFEFMEKWGRFAKAEYLQIYLFVLYIWKKDNCILDISEIAKKLDKDKDTVKNAFEFWESAGLLKQNGSAYEVMGEAYKPETAFKSASAGLSKSSLRERPSYDSAEIDAAASVNKEVDYLFKEAEKILDKILSPSDFELIYSFVDWLGLPIEVVIMLLRFARSRGKTGKRYLETVAIDWADKGIDTFESAEEYIKEIELKLSNEGKIRGILGIYDRALTQTEKKYIKAWTFEKDVPAELVAEAYDRTVMATGKLNWAYMNKILMAWFDSGIKTVDEAREKDIEFKVSKAADTAKPVAKAKRGKFNNYEDTNKPDYSNFAEQLLQDMLDE